MLPLIPIIAIASTAVAVLYPKYLKHVRKDIRNDKLHALVDYAKKHDFEVPVNDDGSFNPNTILSDGLPLLFHFISNAKLLVSLMDLGATPNLCDTSGRPAIVYAAKKNESESVSALLKYGADPNAKDSKGKNGIFHTQYWTILNKLITAGANLNAVDCTGKTALFYSFANGTTKDLIRFGIDVSVKDVEGRTAAFYITGENDYVLVNLLKEHGLDLSIKDNNGISFYDLYPNFECQYNLDHRFYLAVRDNDFSKVNYLLAQGANPNHHEEQDYNMIIVAIRNSNPDMIELLVNHGTDINDNLHRVPLDCAASLGDVVCFKKLLELGADPSCVKHRFECGSLNYQMETILKQFIKN